MRFLVAASLTLLASGCFGIDPVKPTIEGPDFCLVEEARRFSQEEVDWRAAKAPWNLRRDLKTNATGQAKCGWGEEG